MAEYKMIVKECKKCGAPLIQKGDDLYCEYCFTTYQLPKDYLKQKPAMVTQAPSFPQTPPTINGTYKDSSFQNNQDIKAKRNPVGIIFLVVAGISLILFLPKIFLHKQNNPAPINKDLQTESNMFDTVSGGSKEEYPASFIHGTPISLGAIMKTASNDGFTVQVLVQNELEREIIANLKSDQMIIKSVTIIDNLGTDYFCDYYNSFTGNYDVLKPGSELSIGSIECTDPIIPDVKFLKIGLELTNWGSYQFQIPLDSNPQNLNKDFKLYRTDDNFNYTLTFMSSPPQYVGIYFNDISAVDDKGNTYKLDHCSNGIMSLSEDYQFYSYLANNSNMGNASVFCYFDRPLPDEANSVTLILNNRGNTITFITTLDTVY